MEYSLLLLKYMRSNHGLWHPPDADCSQQVLVSLRHAEGNDDLGFCPVRPGYIAYDAGRLQKAPPLGAMIRAIHAPRAGGCTLAQLLFVCHPAALPDVFLVTMMT